MSRRELEALLSDGLLEASTRESEIDRELAAELAEIKVGLEEKEMEL